ncbi:hypothetical protein [Rhodococcus olei]|uniref:hypothetical protein n=1 Tax=Rhodococcus olei TaxID=2161675 RepID=UPI0031F03103
MLGGVLADGGAQGVEFGEHIDRGPDLVAPALRQHLGRGEPSPLYVLASVVPVISCAVSAAEDRAPCRASMIFSSAELLRGRGVDRILRSLAGNDRGTGHVLDEPVGVAHLDDLADQAR